MEAQSPLRSAVVARNVVDLVPTPSPTNVFTQKSVDISVNSFLRKHGLFRDWVENEARRMAGCPASGAALAAAGTGYIMGATGAKMGGVVGGSTLGPPGFVVGALTGALAGVVVGKCVHEYKIETYKLECIQSLHTHPHYVAWASRTQRLHENRRRDGIIKNLDALMLASGVVPRELCCSITGKIVRQACSSNKHRTFDSKLLKEMVPDHEGTFYLADIPILASDVKYNIWSDLVDRDAYRLRANYLNHLLDKACPNIGQEPYPELEMLVLHLQSLEKEALKRALDKAQVNMAKPGGPTQYDPVELVNIMAGIRNAAKNPNYYITVENGKEILFDEISQKSAGK